VLGAGQQVERHVVDQDLLAVALEHVVVVVDGVVEVELVLEARAAAAQHRHAHHKGGAIRLALAQLRYATGSVLGERETTIGQCHVRHASASTPQRPNLSI
jgi:hypothetical protein